MKSYWIQKNNNPKLLLFFSGWGMDPNPFLNIRSNVYDIIIFYDYCDLSNFNIIEIENIITSYSSTDLLAWSMGVWSANFLLKDCKNKFENAVALNGTLQPIDDNFGIPNKVFQLTVDNFSGTSRRSFNKRMCIHPDIFNEFEKNQPQRNDTDLKQELVNLKDLIMFNPIKGNIFTKVLISDNDKIFPSENQIKYWKEKTDYNIIEGPHFMFYKWRCWEEIVLDAAKH